MSLEASFKQKADAVKNLKTSPSDQELLELYSLYKQATVGDVNTEKPGMFALKEKAKWEAWNGRKGLAKDAAMQQYVDKADSLIGKLGSK